MSRRPASRPVRPKRSCSATSMIRRAPSTSAGRTRATTRYLASSTPSHARHTSPASPICRHRKRTRGAMTIPAERSAAEIACIPLSPDFGWGWFAALIGAGIMIMVLAYSLGVLVFVGVGVWGTNVPFVWGFDLTNYVWWIGVANGCSMFAAILVLRRHSLRTAINRFAEGLALFAVICAGIFPIFHLGRPWLFYWMFPYPATFQVW